MYLNDFHFEDLINIETNVNLYTRIDFHSENLINIEMNVPELISILKI